MRMPHYPRLSRGRFSIENLLVNRFAPHRRDAIAALLEVAATEATNETLLDFLSLLSQLLRQIAGRSSRFISEMAKGARPF